MARLLPTRDRRRLLPLAVIAACLFGSVRGSLTIANLNCTFLVSPATAAQIGLSQSSDASSIYAEKFGHLAQLIGSAGVEFVGLETVGGKREVEDLAVRLSGLTGATWKGIFIPGAGQRSGRNLAVIYRPRLGLQILRAGRIRDLATAPLHLVFMLNVDGAEYAICLVDLTYPGAADPEVHATQLEDIQNWAGQQRGTAVIMGTFNEARRKLAPLFSVNENLGWPATELGGKGGDYILSTKALTLGEVIAPPYGANPGDPLRARWTDHFLVKALIP